MKGSRALSAADGAPATLDTQTVTSGSSSSGSDPFFNWYGYRNSAPIIGSISDGTSNLYAGATINGLYSYEEGTSAGGTGYYSRLLILAINGTQANSGWTTMTVAGVNYSRASATFSTAGGQTTWTWNIPIPNPLVSASPLIATSIAVFT